MMVWFGTDEKCIEITLNDSVMKLGTTRSTLSTKPGDLIFFELKQDKAGGMLEVHTFDSWSMIESLVFRMPVGQMDRMELMLPCWLLWENPDLNQKKEQDTVHFLWDGKGWHLLSVNDVSLLKEVKQAH